MANWSLPTTGSTYVNYTAELDARLNDLAYGFDPAVTTSSNVKTNFTRFSSANARWEKYNGSSWVAMATAYAISITGSAATLSTARSIALSGDATGSTTFDGSANVSIAATLANSGVSAGTYGSATVIPQVTVDAKGRVTGVATVTVTPSWVNITSKPTTVSGFGITDAVSNAGSTPSIQAGASASRPAVGMSGRIYIATDTWLIYRDNGSTWDLMEPAYTGDVTKSAGGTALTLSATGVTAGTYSKLTVDAKGRVTAGLALGSTDITSALGYTPYNSSNPSGYITSSALSSYLSLSGGTMIGSLTIRNNAPTINLRDTDSRSAVVHVNNGRFYVLRGDGNDSTTYTAYNGYWPIEANLENNDVILGGNVAVAYDISAYSDERNKTNWRDLPEDFIEGLAQIKHGIYDRIDNPLITQVGVSAQSLQSLLPNAISKDDKGFLSVAYGNAAMVSCVKLAEEVVTLRKRLNALAETIGKDTKCLP